MQEAILNADQLPSNPFVILYLSLLLKYQGLLKYATGSYLLWAKLFGWGILCVCKDYNPPPYRVQLLDEIS